MKKILFLFSLLLAVKSFAQDSVRYGVHLDLAMAKVAGNSYSGFNHLGLQAGFFMRQYYGERNAFQMEANYIQKGSYKGTNPNAGDYTTYQLDLQYAEVAFIFQRKFKKFIWEIGGAPSLLLSAREYMNSVELSNGVPFNFFNVSLLTGGVINLSQHFSMNLRFSSSIIPIREVTGATTFNYYYIPGQFSQQFTLGGFYTF